MTPSHSTASRDAVSTALVASAREGSNSLGRSDNPDVWRPAPLGLRWWLVLADDGTCIQVHDESVEPPTDPITGGKCRVVEVVPVSRGQR